MIRDQAFLDDIREYHEDDAPRLIYADWLEEKGDPERAEFIRVQCELARLDVDDDRVPALRRQSEDLLVKYGKRWTKGLRKYARSYTFTRGFADRVTLPARTFLAHAEDVFSLTPAWHVKIRGARNVLADFLGCVSLRKLRSLSLVANDLGVHRARDLALCPHLRRLTALEVGGNGLAVSGTEALVRSPHLRGLKRLDLRSNSLGPGGAAAVAHSNLLAQLEALHLGGNSLDAHAVRTLADAPGLTGVKSLALGGNSAMGDEGVAALASSPYAANLTSLDLSGLYAAGIGLSASGMRALARSPHLRSLTHLDLTRCWALDNESLFILGAATGLPRLTSLDLTDCRLNPGEQPIRQPLVDHGGFRALLESAFVQRLQRLNLSNNFLGAGISLMGEATYLTGIKWLNLSMCGLRRAEARALAAADGLASLRHLLLAHNDLRDAGASELAAAPLLSLLATLDLSNNLIGDRGAAALARSQRLSNILELDLSNNPIHDRGTRLLRLAFGDRVRL